MAKSNGKDSRIENGYGALERINHMEKLTIKNRLDCKDGQGIHSRLFHEVQEGKGECPWKSKRKRNIPMDNCNHWTALNI